MKVHIEIEGCDASTELEIKCTEEQFAFLREVAKATETVSTYSCMPIMKLSQNDELLELLDEDNSNTSKHLKFIEIEDERGDDCSYYELDTTKL